MKLEAGQRKKAAAARSLWWRLHHWCGLKLSLLMVFVFLTGTLATVSQEMDWLAQPALRASTRVAPMASWGCWFDAAGRALPGGNIEEINAPVARGYAAEITGTDGHGEDRIVYVDPWSAKVQGVSSTLTVRRALRQLHRHLMLPGSIGLPIVAMLSIPLLVLLVTAFPVYKKWWRGFRRWPRPMKRKGDGRRYVGDLHRLAGLWSLWFVTLIGVTGLWYLAEWAGAEALDFPAGATAASSGYLDARSIDAIVEAARREMPDLAIRTIALEDDGIRVAGQASALLVRDRANLVLFDGRTQAAVAAVRGEDLSVHQRISEGADPLHFGTWGGLPSRLMWFAFGLLLTMLAASGALIYALRLKRELGCKTGAGLWRGMGPLAWPCALLVAGALVAVSLQMIRASA